MIAARNLFGALAVLALGLGAVVATLAGTALGWTGFAQGSFTASAGTWEPPTPLACSGEEWSGATVVHLTPAQNPYFAGNGKNIIFGTPGADTIHGGNGKDCIIGGGGDDTIFGENGPDYIDGGDGTDFCDGGNGPDTIISCEQPGDTPEQDDAEDEAVEPVLECVEKLSGSAYVAHFGYKNEGDGAVTIAAGTDNGFTPAPQDRGQATVFQPGLHKDVFTVAFDGSPLKWTLKGPDGSTRSVTADKHSDKCEHGGHEDEADD